MAVPSRIRELVDRFHADLAYYKSGQYNETQARQEFIDPLFEALGWDIGNRGGAAAAFREVVLEYSMKIGATTKAPDYLFRVNAAPKFFVEAKKPAVNLKETYGPAYQVRRYAWTARLPLSILTDFDEFVIYDTRVEPHQNDKTTTARHLYVPYTEYAERWDAIAELFDRDAVRAGSLDRFAQAVKAPKGSQPVDKAFLAEIDAWRELLARNIYLWDRSLSTRDLNYAVQMTIDRMIFLRIAEDRGIEVYGRLQELLKGGEVYKRLLRLFEQADNKYNSGLFHFTEERGRAEAPDTLTPKLHIDDEALKTIIRGMYYPESPYEFSVLPVEVLGNVYEQFLGKVITIGSKATVTVEAKPEVRKAGGVYYTPQYIVDYIVANTVGKLLEGKTPKQAEALRLLDPACGSGSFLIGAYQYLLDWHVQQYVAAGPQKHKKQLYQAQSGEWQLTTAERKRILLNNIYGVDLDSQAVEVTKLSLCLKMLEGENAQSIAFQQSFIQERVLPDLNANIKCGNSLIGPDFYATEAAAGLSHEELLRINPFDWQAEFPAIMRAGGFDAVIGNPPYIRIQTMAEWSPMEADHHKKLYSSASQGNYDIYVVFVEKGLSLLRLGGLLGFILPHKFFNAQYGSPLRNLIADGGYLSEIVHFGHQQIFVGATTYTCLLFLDKNRNVSFDFYKVDDLDAWRMNNKAVTGTVKSEEVSASEWNFDVGSGADLFQKLRWSESRLGDVASIFVGLQTSADRIYVLNHVDFHEDDQVQVKDRNGDIWFLERDLLKPFLNDVTVSTYEQPTARHWLIFPYQITEGKIALISSEEIANRSPRLWEYLKANESILRGRESGKADHDNWYGYIYRKNLTLFDAPKLIVQVISLFGRYALDVNSVYFTGGGNGPYYGVRWNEKYKNHSLFYIQALLGARLLDFFLYRVSTPFRGGYWSYGKRFIEQLPIRTINFTDPADVARHDQIVQLVERMLELNKRLAEAKNAQDKTVLQRQIAATDREIDRLVYALYELTDAEIALVEAAVKR